MPKKKQTTDEDLALLGELGLDTAPEKPKKLSAKQERIIAGFEEIERFVEEQGRLPQHGENRDIFERLYAVRLDRLRESEECREVLKSLDAKGLLEADNNPTTALAEDITDEDLLATLGLETAPKDDITQLKRVRSRSEIKAAEEVAQRNPCEDFEQFKPLFESVQSDLEAGLRTTLKYQDNAAVKKGDLFILDGHIVLVADMGEPFIAEYGRQDCRLRVVYDNGTESDLLRRSLQRALNKDKASRRISHSNFGPLFSNNHVEENDSTTGLIYILRSQSDNPFIAENRSVIHKIGVTSGDVQKRIANAKKDPTYLLADVEVVTTFKLANINAKKLEVLLLKFFGSARLDVELQDRFGQAVKPREWFLVPLEVIEQAIEKIIEGTIEQFRYDPENACLARI